MAEARFTWRGIEFRIKSYKRQDSLEGGTLTMEYYVEWADRIAARIALLGGTQCLGSQPSYLTRDLPHRLEWDGTISQHRILWCRSVATDPAGAAADPEVDGEPNWTDALLTAIYDVTPYELLEDSEIRDTNNRPDETTLRRYISYPEPKSKNKVLTLKGGTWIWSDNLKDVTESTYISLPDMEHTIMWHQIPWNGIPWATIQSLLNFSNNAIFSAQNWPVEFVVFSDFLIQQKRLPDGKLSANIGYVFDYKSQGANRFPDPERGGSFHAIKAKDGSSRKPYPPGNLSLLFIPIFAP